MKPKTIFKHYDTSIISLLNLKKHVLYMGSPSKFNDAYDCALGFKFDKFNDAEIENLKNKFIDLEDSNEIKSRIRKQSIEDFRLALAKGSVTAINKLKDSFLKSNGVCCFTETNSELLMWAHYSDSYQGFCLEFNTHFEPFNKLHQVIYVDNFPKNDLLHHVLNDDYNILPQLYCTKSIKWKHEKEWRVLHSNVGTEYRYKTECLKAIYFGPKIDPDLKEIICLILKGQNPKVELWEGQLSDNEFNINFKQFTFITYTDAKAMGLRE